MTSMSHRSVLSCLGAIAAALVLAFPAAFASPRQVEISQAEARGSLFGFGAGLASAVVGISKPTRVEQPKSNPAGLELRIYAQSGLKVVFAKSPTSETPLPIEVELQSAQAIRAISKELSELKKPAVIANFGQPESQSGTTFRYRGLAESCSDNVELHFQAELLSAIKWSFCAE